MKLTDDVAQRIKQKVDFLKTRAGHKKLISDIFFPSKQKEKDRQNANLYGDFLDKKIKAIEPLIRSLRSHIDYIGDPDKFVAAYLLIGKSFTSLKAVSILVRQGYSFQITELVRSSIESLDLSMLFFEDGQEEVLKKWFNGEIVGNRKTREALNAAVNKMKQDMGDEQVPMKEALSDVYSIYSAYTHSGYSALFDFIDVFKEDFDFDQYSQFHYNGKYFHLIDNLYFHILLALKNYYIRAKDEENLAKVETFMSQEGGQIATQEEIDKEMARYKDGGHTA